MNQISGLNSETTVVVAVLLAFDLQRPRAQVDVESHGDAVSDITILQTLNSTNPSQTYKVSRVSKSQTAIAQHNSDSLEVWYVLISFPDYQY
ncbi:hypothetical protein BFJ66_g5464 [Fusarium oxysporum f. sp. cepae]|uniref:Uncharacterized protein n=1 Tax=Fusarium oxysporum f. sp. cepae TaxID=396571 RepID=A0A3L6N4V8_FUSOX|nr:hypothetical protein BFJ65_g14340 [Fusarium oxysporum f. sp. cepae]RKK42347.1 hypothetical protein BFJ67_g10142 [Fusarium oxysporum f. sp. cepae]RKK52748.1 hypothetical protein BFJ66_g5464 [Fusarium oxysporum f. sp. cepae]